MPQGQQSWIDESSTDPHFREPYSYNAFKIGLVVLAFGGGSLLGSVIGGRLSDRALAKSRRINKGINIPEVRCCIPA